MPIIKQIYFTHPNANNMKCGLQNALAELVRWVTEGVSWVTDGVRWVTDGVGWVTKFEIEQRTV